MRKILRTSQQFAKNASGEGLFKLNTQIVSRQNNFKLPLNIEVTK